MKIIATLILLVFIIDNISGQISKTKVASKKDRIDNNIYDSTLNFLGKKPYGYIGQTLYVLGKSKDLRKYGYEGFLIDYKKDNFLNDDNVYKGDGGFNSSYDGLAEKYFVVLDVISDSEEEENEFFYPDFFLVLQEKLTKDTVYFKYSSQFEHSFPFLVVGFYDRQKNDVVGIEYVFADGVLKSSIDIETGHTITASTGQIWKCIDLTVEEKYYSLSLVIQNPIDEKTTITYESVFGDYRKGRAYTITEFKDYESRFGKEKLNSILQGKVLLGMTKEMCQLSWGEPNSINETISTNGISEQWVYSDNYLYFDNGILTAIQ